MAAPIQIVAPYAELADLSRQVVGETAATDAAVTTGDLVAGLEGARAALANGAEVMVSRGGTALLLKRHLPCPVVEIGVSAYDLLRCLTALPRGYQGKIGIVGFENIVNNAGLVGQAMNLDIALVTLTESTSVTNVLAQAVADGVQVVIGDAVTVRSAQEMGIPGLLITSGREAIDMAVKEAQRILQVMRHERQRAAELKAILDSSHDAVVAVDQHNQIKLFNRKAAELFEVPHESKVLGLPILAALGNKVPADLFTGGDQLQGRIHRVGDFTVMVNRVTIQSEGRPVGSVATFQDVTALQRAEQKVRRELHAKGLVAKNTLDDIVTESPVMRRVIDLAARYAGSDSTVLIQGESGTGKELFAQGIHNASPRRSGPFVAVNCAAIPESLLESELFGHVEGSFTGASKGGRAGLFELAHHGTIFLDEVGEMPLPLQSRLLRVLQEREVMRIGSDRVLPVNIRVIAATNRPLEEEVAAGRFRADLYYRLNILSVKVPPVRERPADVPVLLARFLQQLAAKRGRPAPVLGPEWEAALSAHRWPGNVRELKGFAERIDLTAADGAIDLAALAELGLGGPGALAVAPSAGDNPVTPRADSSETIALAGTLDEMTERIIAKVLAAEEGNVSRAARRLGVDRTTLWRRLRK
ncbi:MAG TPA: sigma 54-interacting transcriptional regulator [Symbiobacteriaceae bacterium]|nr:sigma 54-interacting transcriptional regulator [Symbiobacteriaceae bacterium]